MKLFALSLALLAPATSLAYPMEDITLIRTLLAPGTDVAQIQAAVLRGEDRDEALTLGKENYLMRDLNGDRVEDILVVVEENPKLLPDEESDPKPCEIGDSDHCYIAYGRRSLDLFLGLPQGGYARAFSNNQMVLGADEGGLFGDPLEGFSVKKSGAVTINYYGGSAWRWSYTDVMQFRNGNFYIIGRDSYYGWTGDLRSETKSVNLITGQVVETKQKDGTAPVRTRRYRIPVKPLVPVAEYKGPMHE